MQHDVNGNHKGLVGNINTQFISAGRVGLNGKVTEFRQKANPAVDKITVDGESIVPAESLIPNALYKPRNVLCSHPCFGYSGSSAANNFY